MNILIKKNLFSFFLLLQCSLFAHNSNISSLRLNIQGNGAILEFSLSQYGIEQALIKKYPDLNLKTIESDDFKEILIKYIKENVILYVNGTLLEIGTGVIRLQSHQSDLKFKVTNLPKDPKYIDIDAHCFQENKNQKIFFRLIYNGLTARVELSEVNNFKSRFNINENQITVTKNTSLINLNSSYFIWSVITVFIIIIMIVFFLKLRKNKN